MQESSGDEMHLTETPSVADRRSETHRITCPFISRFAGLGGDVMIGVNVNANVNDGIRFEEEWALCRNIKGIQ